MRGLGIASIRLVLMQELRDWAADFSKRHGLLNLSNLCNLRMKEKGVKDCDPQIAQTRLPSPKTDDSTK